MGQLCADAWYQEIHMCIIFTRWANFSKSVKPVEKTKICKRWYTEKAWHMQEAALTFPWRLPWNDITLRRAATAMLHHHHHHHTLVITISMVMWSPKVSYFKVLKFLITLTSASAVAPSSPILVHWYLVESRLDKEYIRKKSKTQIQIVWTILFYRNIQHPILTFLYVAISRESLIQTHWDLKVFR